MKFLKILGAVLLTVCCLAVIVWCGGFLWNAIPRASTPPQVLNTDAFLDAPEEEIAPPAEEPPVEEPPVEEPPAEEPPAEEPPAEEPPAEEPPAEEPPAEEPQTPAASDESRELARTYLAEMSLEEKLWQLFLVTPDALSGESTSANDATRDALAAKPVGGLIYFADNLQNREQTIAMLAATQGFAQTPLFLGVDEEGGAVSRAGANEAMGVTHLPTAASYGEAGDANAVYEAGGTLAGQLKELGFNLDFAPVADIITNPNNTEIGDRAYSSDPAAAAKMVDAMVRGLEEGGMASCLKHFPGHGSTQADSHEGLSVSTRTIDELRQNEWVPFQAGIDAGASFVMVGHQTNENFSAFPASLSPMVMAYLRTELGFDGVIITDSLRMGAIVGYYTSAQAAVMAIQAGADMLLMPNDLQTAFDGLKAAVVQGAISESRIDESVLRILTAKADLGLLA